MESLSEWLKRSMQEKGISQRELASRTGVWQTAVKGWIAGVAVPNWHNCRQLADALGADREYVRQLAGFIDPEDEEVTAGGNDLAEIIAGYRELEPPGREALLTSVRALLALQRATGNRR